MRVIKVRNVNDAFYRGIELFTIKSNFRKQMSRNGSTLESNEPVVTVYLHPWERVLFDKDRDANPFFHLIESIWMLAGNRELHPLTYFNSGMSNFSDDGENLNGAYGYRWINKFGFDQIQMIIELLERDPESRRAVLQMWDCVHDLDSSSKDVPCNTQIFFKVRSGKLQMTVCNRSNDMIWGAYGANAVHMSILQEYIAAALDVRMGAYYQVSDSFHVYENKSWDSIKHKAGLFPTHKYPEVYPLVSNPKTFPFECENFIKDISGVLDTSTLKFPEYENHFFNEVLKPMVKAFVAHKERNYADADRYLSEIKANDWKVACTNWIEKRRTAYEKKHG